MIADAGNGESDRSRWGDYYRATADRPPWELYRQAVARFRIAGAAIDLGCGSGVETLDLLRRGWQALAVDRESQAIKRLFGLVPAEQRDRLRGEIVSFQDMTLPSADLIWAGVSLPFCDRERFPAVWQKVLAALKSGGRFAGHFFGVRHHAAPRDSMTFHTREQIERLFENLRIEYFVEEEGERPTALDGIRHWHQYGVVAQKG